jgi:deoxyribodipyrimidine photo-lyase
MAKRVLFWFRNDLRVRDNYPLLLAEKEIEAFFPVFCFDERWFKKDSLGFPRTGHFRLKFLIETLTELQKELTALGSGLYITFGKPEEQIPPLAFLFGAEEVWASRESAYDETSIEKQMESGLQMPFRLFDTSPLVAPNQLTFSLAHLPDTFSSFRKEVEPILTRVKALQSPRQLPPYPTKWGYGEMIKPSELGISPIATDQRTAFPFAGGAQEAHRHLDQYFHQTKLIHQYKETRNQLIGVDYSSKLSPWLANGAISARSVFSELRTFIQHHGANESSLHFVSELLWRDYFRLVVRKHGAKIFSRKGIKTNSLFYRKDPKLFKNWTLGKTGRDFVDSQMQELLHTGFMSNRGRQNAASFLCKDLKIDWRWGARWFESCLIDYDVSNNWGNWMYVAGVGNDPRPDRYFNIEKQAEMYDPDKAHRRLWLPDRFPPQVSKESNPK